MIAAVDIKKTYLEDRYGDSPEFLSDINLENEAIAKAVDLLRAHKEVVELIIETDFGEIKLERAGRVCVNTYLAQQAYGGPEEGGWWYDTETPVACHIMHNVTLEEALAALEAEAAKYADEDKSRDYYSVNAQGMHRVRLEPHVGSYWPKVRPHYE